MTYDSIVLNFDVKLLFHVIESHVLLCISKVYEDREVYWLVTIQPNTDENDFLACNDEDKYILRHIDEIQKMKDFLDDHSVRDDIRMDISIVLNNSIKNHTVEEIHGI